MRIGARRLVAGATFQVGKNMRIGLVGRNGAGKTTMTKLLAAASVAQGSSQAVADADERHGLEAVEQEGTIACNGSVGYLPQDTKVGDLTSPRLLAGIAALLITAVPFMLIGIAIGYLMSSKAAVAAAQVLMLALAFGGGLFIPPRAFPDWLANVSFAMPTRSALEISSWVAGIGTEHVAPALVGFLAWSVGLTIICLILATRDGDREYGS